jgi:hypothetical protein
MNSSPNVNPGTADALLARGVADRAFGHVAIPLKKHYPSSLVALGAAINYRDHDASALWLRYSVESDFLSQIQT